MKKPVNILSLVLIGFFISISTPGYSQADSINKKRLTYVVGGSAVTYGTALFLLNQLWYKDYPRSSFHFFNDNHEWLQMDKIGHATASYYEGELGIELMKWAGLPRKKAIWWGGLYGTFLQTPIEILDGFSSEWGASVGDLAANSFGSALVISQALAWDEQRINMKFSFSRTDYAPIRPNTLGNGFQEEVLKDYNGQIYWLSGNIASFIKKEDSKFPKWLNVAVGYGGNGMISNTDNHWTDADGNYFDYGYIPTYRQYYLAPDIDLTKIETNSRVLKGALKLFSLIKVPLPALEYNTHSQFRFHWMKF